jgi:hypothetical protein
MFKCFEPDNAMEAMMACHCVMLRYMAMAAMRDAVNVSLDPRALARVRSSAMAMSKELHVWVGSLQKMKIRNEARMAEPIPAPEPKQTRQPTPAPVREKRKARPALADPFEELGGGGLPFRRALLASTPLARGVRTDGTISPPGAPLPSG